MNKSGIIYPDSGDKQVFDDIGAFNEAVGVYGEKTESITIENAPSYLKTNQNISSEQDTPREKSDLKTGRNNFEMNINRPFSVKLEESPFKADTAGKRRFSSDRVSQSTAQDDSSQRDSGYLLTIGGSGRKNDIRVKKEVIREKKALRDTQIKNAGGRNSTSEKQKKPAVKVNRKSFLKFYKEKKLKDAQKENNGGRKKDSDGKLINLMFIFEIFKWFGSSDIIVRFIVGAIAGIAAFGYIFTQMGLLGSL